MIHLIPTYRTLLKRIKPQTKTVSVWSVDSTEIFAFACTDWELFHNMDIEDATETITGFINFCMDTIVVGLQRFVDVINYVDYKNTSISI